MLYSLDTEKASLNNPQKTNPIITFPEKLKEHMGVYDLKQV
jgi:hypothetical protein